MRGYLLDTNILRFWFDEDRAEHGSVVDQIGKLPEDTPLTISAITLGEIEYGHRAESDEETPIQREFRQFVETQLGVTGPPLGGEWPGNVFQRFRLGVKT